MFRNRKDSPPTIWISAQHAADMLGISRQTLVRNADWYGIRYYKTSSPNGPQGNRWWFSRGDVLKAGGDPKRAGTQRESRRRTRHRREVRRALQFFQELWSSWGNPRRPSRFLDGDEGEEDVFDSVEWVNRLPRKSIIVIYLGRIYLGRVEAMWFRSADSIIEEYLLRNYGPGHYRLIPYFQGRLHPELTGKAAVGMFSPPDVSVQAWRDAWHYLEAKEREPSDPNLSTLRAYLWRRFPWIARVLHAGKAL